VDVTNLCFLSRKARCKGSFREFGVGRLAGPGHREEFSLSVSLAEDETIIAKPSLPPFLRTALVIYIPVENSLNLFLHLLLL
jgi:hypothetical protein